MNLFLKILVAVLVFFVPFSFAATEPWAFSILQGLIVAGWIGLLAIRKEFVYSPLIRPVLYVFFVLIAIGIVQICFPRTLLEGAFSYPITLARLYTLDHLALFMTYLALVGLISQVYPSLREVKQLLLLLILSGVLVSLCAVVFPRGEYIRLLTGVRTGTDAVGPFLNRNHGGVFLAMNTLLGVGLLFTHQLKYNKMIGSQQRKSFWVGQCWLAVMSIGLGVACVFSRSRGAMLSLFTGLFCYGLLCMYAVPAQLKKRLKGIFCTLLLLIACSAWIYTHIPQINDFALRTNASKGTRKMMYRSANQILQQYPVWGIGIGAMPVAITSYTEWDVHQYIERLHNDWLEITLGIGWLGSICLWAGLICFAYSVLRRLRRLEIHKQFLFAALLSTLFAMAVGSSVDFHFFIPGCALVFFLVLGLLVTPTFCKGRIHILRLGWTNKTLLLILLISMCWIPLQKTRAWRAFLFGKGLKTQSKLAYYKKGLSYYPSPRNAVRLGNAYYNASIYAKDPVEKRFYLEMAQSLAAGYLEKYPKEKELSRLYMRIYRQIH